MRDNWYSDARDLVKWAALVHIAKREQLRAIVQVAMFRPGKRLTIETGSGRVEIPQGVWAHFRDLRGIQTLGRTVGVEISVIDEPFAAKDRGPYFGRVVEALQRISGSKAVLLDPDTGFEPDQPNANHVTGGDVRAIWNALGAGDWLLLYQHRWRDKQWISHANSKFAGVCGGTNVEVFRASASPSDVILLGACKSQVVMPNTACTRRRALNWEAPLVMRHR